MPKIKAYHPVISVENGSKKESIELDMDDYYSEAEVKQALKEATGARTAGEAVDRVRSGALQPQRASRIIDARIVGSDDNKPTVRLDWASDLN